MKSAMTKAIKKFSILILLLFIPGILQTQVPYDTYTYSYFGNAKGSPHVYVPRLVVQLNDGLAAPADMAVDVKGYIYITDTGNNRIIILSENYKYHGEILEFMNPDGISDKFNMPQGIFVHSDGRIFVADTKNRRIVVFNNMYQCIHIIPEPVSPVLPRGFTYEPFKVAVDYADRVYVAALTTNQGIIELDMNGNFRNFIGARRVEADLLSLFWRFFQTEEQRARSLRFVPTEFNNIAIDERGFLYVTTNSIDRSLMYRAIRSRTTDGRNLPVQRLSPSGRDVLVRGSFYPPAGDLPVSQDMVSSIVSVALGENGVYSILDQLRGKIFTYDAEGALLYAFGGIGLQEGLSERPSAIAYNGTDLLLLGSRTGKMTVFRRTPYGDILHAAIDAYSQRKFIESFDKWEQVLRENNNLDIAYIGMGKSKLFNGEYREALDNFKIGNDTYYYSRALFMYRQVFIRANFWWLIPVVLAIFILIWLGVKTAGKVNKNLHLRHTLTGELSYGFYIIFHPFDGFYDARYEKRGSLRAAFIILFLAGAAFIFERYTRGFVFADYRVQGLNPLALFLELVLPVTMWCVVNWCLTTLMDGEGGMEHIFTAAGYSMLPVVLLLIPAGIISNFIVQDEAFILAFIKTTAFGWMGILLFFGMLVTHNYSLPKNILACLLTIVGMAVLLFLLLLGFDILGRIVRFVTDLYQEINFRSI